MAEARDQMRRAGMALREIRERRGMSQGELARKAKLSQAMVSLTESGKRLPSPGVLDVLCGIVGARVSITIHALKHPACVAAMCGLKDCRRDGPCYVNVPVNVPALRRSASASTAGRKRSGLPHGSADSADSPSGERNG